MKINFHRSKQTQGSALLVTVMIVAAVAATLETYLLMVQGQYRSVIRSQTWNTSLVVAEAGVEEGLALVNKYQATTNLLSAWTNTTTTVGSVGSDGWTKLSESSTLQVYTITRTLTNGSYTVYVTNVLTATSSIPAIVSSGTANWKLDTASAAQPMFASSGVAASSPTRGLFVQTSPDPLITGGLIAITTMNFNGNNVTVDSYDSSTNTKSWFGPNGTNFVFKGNKYGIYTNALRTAEAVVATLASGSSIVNVGNANIYGYVDTGPGGTASVGANGSVGDLSWCPATHGLQPGHAKDDMNTVFPDWPLPAATYIPLTRLGGSGTNITIGGSTIAYNYVIQNIPGGGNGPFYYQILSQLTDSLLINASNVVLYLPAGWKYTGSSVLTLGPNSDVKIFSAGDISTAGSASINNFANYPFALGVFGLPSCANISFGGNGGGSLFVYAPEAAVTFGGGGGGTFDVCGAFICSTVTAGGHYNFHFDVALKTLLPPSRYVPVSWKER
jgi:hypothetical protein